MKNFKEVLEIEIRNQKEMELEAERKREEVRRRGMELDAICTLERTMLSACKPPITMVACSE